mgnify:CR=1 FL=1
MKRSKYETTIREEKAKSTYVARMQASRDVSAPKRQPIARPRVGIKPQRKTVASFEPASGRYV